MINRDPESSGETDATTTALVPVRQRSASLLAPTEIVSGFPMPTRRRFLATASTAAVGLMIRPLHVYGEPVYWSSIGNFFKNFAKGILFQFLGGAMPGNFGGIAQSLLSLFTGHKYFPDSYGNGGSGNTLDQLLNLIGSAERRNVGTAFLKQNGADISGVYPAGSTVALSFIVKQVLAQTLPLLLGKMNVGELTEQQIQDLKQRYFLPALQGDFSNIAKDTLRRVLTPADPYKQLYETETGALVYIGYEPGTTPNANRGEGQATVRVVPPGAKKDAVMKYINQHSNFWTNDAVQNELVNKYMRYNRINTNMDHPIEYEFPR